jgi:hypothetical protein
MLQSGCGLIYFTCPHHVYLTCIVIRAQGLHSYLFVEVNLYQTIRRIVLEDNILTVYGHLHDNPGPHSSSCSYSPMANVNPSEPSRNEIESCCIIELLHCEPLPFGNKWQDQMDAENRSLRFRRIFTRICRTRFWHIRANKLTVISRCRLQDKYNQSQKHLPRIIFKVQPNIL